MVSVVISSFYVHTINECLNHAHVFGILNIYFKNFNDINFQVRPNCYDIEVDYDVHIFY